jgi:hypothetical protein
MDLFQGRPAGISPEAAQDLVNNAISLEKLTLDLLVESRAIRALISQNMSDGWEGWKREVEEMINQEAERLASNKVKLIQVSLEYGNAYLPFLEIVEDVIGKSGDTQVHEKIRAIRDIIQGRQFENDGNGIPLESLRHMAKLS